MRTLLFVLLALFATPALAQGWDHYENGRLGYGIDIPPGFSGNGESDNGDGQSFYSEDGGKVLLVWGGNLMGPFESEVASTIYSAGESGWNIAYEAVTPRWASFSGVKGSRILYQRMVMLCDGTSYAAFRAEYSAADAGEMDAVIEKLVLTLKASAC
jgi:hypothetical protein